MPTNPITATIAAGAKGVEGVRRMLGVLRPVVAAIAVVLGLAAPAGAGQLEVRVIEKPKVVTISLEGTSLLAWDLCWSPTASTVRQRLADEAASRMTGPGPFVLRAPQLPAEWQAAPAGSMKDSAGQPIPRSRVLRGKNTYSADVEDALLDLLKRIRERKPGAMIAFTGYAPQPGLRGTTYGKLRERSDFIFSELDLTARMRHTDQRRPVEQQVRAQRSWLESLGMDTDTPVVVPAGSAWIVVSDSDLPDGFVARSTGSQESAQTETDQSETPAEAAPAGADPAPAQTVTQRAPGNPDINGDGLVNSVDRALLLGAWNSTDAACDLNGDGRVNSIDLALLLGAMNPVPQQPAQVQGVFTPESTTYVRNSQINLGFTITAGAPAGANVVFHVTPDGASQPLVVHYDGTAPFVVPWQLVNAVPFGNAEVKALVRNGDSNVVATFTRTMTFVAAAAADDDGQENGETPPSSTPSNGGASNPAPQVDFTLGMNVGGNLYYTREWLFADCFKVAEEFASSVTQRSPDGWPIPTGEQQAHFLVFRDTGGNYPGGRYTLMWDGEGEVCVFGWDTPGISPGSPRTVVSAASTPASARKIQFDVVPAEGGIQIRVMRSNPANPVKNIRCYMPGFAPGEPNAGQVFHPTYVDRLRGFGIVRFMPWCGVGNTEPVTWAQRTTPNSPRQTLPAGVAIEYMIDLTNQLGSDPWFCVPHLASDDYIRGAAQLFKQRMAPGRKVYVEFSNEVWNFVFEQAQWNNRQAMAQGISFQENYRRNCMRVFQIFQEVFGSEMSTRVRRVLATQLHNRGVTYGILDRYQTGTADVLSPAFYFYCDIPEQEITDATPLTSIIESARNNIRTTLREHVEFITNFARERGLEVVGYEGGQHLANIFGGSSAAIRKYGEANRDPRMYDLYQELLATVKNGGVKGFAHLGYVSNQFGQYGAWGALNTQDQPVSRQSAPKYQALLDFLTQQAQARSRSQAPD